ncbi:hypothetical protein [Lysobacter sp. Root604]|uniref:hypothetical protein n=1 Tax=Lysobacter sp. Root604 TaxID=1736568 RepID=UPI0012FCB8E2|nr:hypothetical protein [Lysobacter sp. Root604]
MPITTALTVFQAKAAQCDSLIASGHRANADGAPLFSALDREQITVAAFLNFFIAWEEFVETTFAHFLLGIPTISGVAPVRYANPPGIDAAKKMVIGLNKYFDYSNQENIKKAVGIYFEGGYPFKQHIDSVSSDLSDMRTMRNASAHISSTTQTALEGLAQRIFGAPQPGITLYTLLTSLDPRLADGGTVYSGARDKILAAAVLIAQG